MMQSENMLGNVAVYRGKSYKAFYSFQDEKVVLLSQDPSDQARGFEEKTPMRFSKRMDCRKLDGAYSYRTFGLYKGYKVQLLAIIDGRYHAGVLSDGLGVALGFEQIDKGSYVKVLERHEFDAIWKERHPIWGFTELPENIKFTKLKRACRILQAAQESLRSRFRK